MPLPPDISAAIVAYLRNGRPKSSCRRLSSAHSRHTSALLPDARSVGMLPGWKRAKPYVYSDAEIDALLTAALALRPANGLRRWTYHALFGLNAVTGISISEGMSLERDEVDLGAGVLTVRQSEFGRSRLL